jgi:hypothetical protein
MIRAILLALAVLVILALTWRGETRSYHHRRLRSLEVRREFQRENPCPSTGLPYGPCRAYEADHAWPLCAGGADSVANLRRQELAEAKIKDEDEAELCRGELSPAAFAARWGVAPP